MKTTIGDHLKVTMAASVRPAVRALYEGALGATLITPVPALDVFRFGDRQLGVYFVDGGEVLSRAQHQLGVWLELVVEDVEAAARAVSSAGAQRFPYHDEAHPYFQDPGGLVFRLAAAAA